MSELVCDIHGPGPETAICSHMFADWKAGRPFEMVVQTATEDDPWPDAWCEICETEFQQKYDELTDGFSASAGLVLLCAHCYSDVRAAAERSGKLRIV